MDAPAAPDLLLACCPDPLSCHRPALPAFRRSSFEPCPAWLMDERPNPGRPGKTTESLDVRHPWHKLSGSLAPSLRARQYSYIRVRWALLVGAEKERRQLGPENQTNPRNRLKSIIRRITRALYRCPTAPVGRACAPHGFLTVAWISEPRQTRRPWLTGDQQTNPRIVWNQGSGALLRRRTCAFTPTGSPGGACAAHEIATIAWTNGPILDQTPMVGALTVRPKTNEPGKPFRINELGHRRMALG